jgi:aromatic-amino-acid transaminase
LSAAGKTEHPARAQYCAAAPCCHNPTGADLTNAQWDAVIEVLKARNLIPFLDIAYQGFGAGMEEDAYAIRAVASAGLPVLVSNSFSKIFSLYGERVGGLSVVCEDAEAAGACWAS